MAKDLVVEGFVFETSEGYNDALKEAEAISYIKAKTDLNNSTALVKLYNKLIDKQTFITPIGINFLKELHDRIIDSGVISKDNLRPVPVKHVIKKQSRSVEGFIKDSDSRMKIRLSYIEKKLNSSRIINVFLVIIILIMFAITMFSDRSPFINAEVKFQNKYAEWEEDLIQREKVISEKEKELGITKE